MGCILHFMGNTVDVAELLSHCPIEPCVTFKKGEPRSTRPNARLCATSGINLLVSESDFEYFEIQKAEAIKFLKLHMNALLKLRAVRGIEHASIDFGIAMRNVVMQSDAFEVELIELVAPLRLQIVLSQYPVSRKTSKIKQYRRALRKAI